MIFFILIMLIDYNHNSTHCCKIIALLLSIIFLVEIALDAVENKPVNKD